MGALPDDLVEAILLQLPPDDPASLLRAALVCKGWCRIVSDPGFHRRFRGLHRTPPTLGFLHRKFFIHEACFVPAATSSLRRLPHAVGLEWLPLDALHGHILFSDIEVARGTNHLGIIVWNPMTDGEVRRLPILVPPNAGKWTGRLLCAAPPGEDHHADDCVLRVVVLSRCRSTGITSAIVYSPEQHAWSVQASIHHDDEAIAFFGVLRSARIGNADALYFAADGRNKSCLKYDVAKQQLSMMSLPTEPPWKKNSTIPDIRFMITEKGGLGLAMVDGYNLYTLSWEEEEETGGRWGNQRVFSLSELLPPNISEYLYLPTVVDVPGVIWIGTEIGLFSIDTKSSQVRKLCDGGITRYNMGHIVPYMNFCTPAAVKSDNVESEDDSSYGETTCSTDCPAAVKADNVKSEDDDRYDDTSCSTDCPAAVKVDNVESEDDGCYSETSCSTDCPAAVKADNVESEDDGRYGETTCSTDCPAAVKADNFEPEDDGCYGETTCSTDRVGSVSWSDVAVRYMYKLGKCCRGRIAFFPLFGIVLCSLASRRKL